MRLNQYLHANNMSQATLSKMIAGHPLIESREESVRVRISNYINFPSHNPSLEMAIAIEDVTEGKVTVRELICESRIKLLIRKLSRYKGWEGKPRTAILAETHSNLPFQQSENSMVSAE